MFSLPPLPYAYDALDPIVSDDTLHVHHDKHHKAYVDKANDLVKKAGLEGKSLEEVVREAFKRGDKPLFNNAAQAWNHAFYWQCMAPGGKACTGQLKAAIEKTFGSVGEFQEKFIQEGVGHFGSGWVWLVTGSEGLKIISTHDADDTLVKDGLFPLLVCDVWEHAYYLDYQNDRKEYLKLWLDKAANYFFAEQQMFAADGKGEGYRYDAPTTGAGDAKAGEKAQPQA